MERVPVSTGFTRYGKGVITAMAAALLYAGHAHAQSEFSVSAEPEQETRAFSLSRNTVAQTQSDGSLGEAVNLNFGVLYSPVNRLDLRADAWRVQQDSEQVPVAAGFMGPVPRLFIDDSAAPSIERPFANIPGGPGMQSQGIDLSASYVWESPRFGQFILSTRASYVYDFGNTDRLRDPALAGESAAPVLGSEIQSSLTLTWQIGNHTASAVTHYTDSFEELSKLNVEEFSELVGNLTTLDLQYGYTLKAGRQGNAMISVGLRSVLDKRAGSLQDLSPVGAERNGRMAYGSIKYQF
jgi:hypothetical protein